MKFFAILFSVIGVALFSSVAVLAQDQNELVSGIESITSASAKLNVTISAITPRNFPFQGYKIPRGLKNIAKVVEQFNDQFGPDASAMHAAEEENTHALTERDVSASVCDAIVGPLSILVGVHQALLATVIGTKSIASKWFLTKDIAKALRTLEGAIDDFVYTIFDLCPSDVDKLKPGFDLIQEAFMNALKTFEG